MVEIAARRFHCCELDPGTSRSIRNLGSPTRCSLSISPWFRSSYVLVPLSRPQPLIRLSSGHDYTVVRVLLSSHSSTGVIDKFITQRRGRAKLPLHQRPADGSFALGTPSGFFSYNEIIILNHPRFSAATDDCQWCRRDVPPGHRYHRLQHQARYAGLRFPGESHRGALTHHTSLLPYIPVRF